MVDQVTSTLVLVITNLRKISPKLKLGHHLVNAKPSGDSYVSSYVRFVLAICTGVTFSTILQTYGNDLLLLSYDTLKSISTITLDSVAQKIMLVSERKTSSYKTDLDEV